MLCLYQSETFIPESPKIMTAAEEPDDLSESDSCSGYFLSLDLCDNI